MNKDVEITDIRDAKEFRLITINGYKKTEVKRELIKSLSEGDVEPCCYWSAQLVCSGHFVELWDIIITFYTKHIHIGNPLLALYFEKRIGNFKDVIQNSKIRSELELRNNMQIRTIFAEMVIILARTTKRPKLEEVKVNPEYFDMTNITSKLRAPDVSHAKIVFTENDPKEIFIAINELSYTLTSTGGDTLMACFWVEWIMEYKRIRHNKKQTCNCDRRNIDFIEEKYQRNVDWLVWELFIKIAEKKSDKRIINIIKSLRKIYTLKYSSTIFRKRRFVFYMAIFVLMEVTNVKNQLLDEYTKNEIKHVCANINGVYKQIKERDVLPGDAYVSSPSTPALSKQDDKLNKMKEINSIYIPRL